MSNPLEKNWPRAILLDFYGTVVEEIRIPVQKICEHICSAFPAAVIKDSEVVAYWASIFMDLCSRSYGTSFELQKVLEQRSLQAVLEHFQINLDSHSLSSLLSEYRCCPTLFMESRKVLSLCNVPVCLVTNIDNYEISRAIENTGLHFDYVVTSEDCRAYKPRPEIFRRALSRLNLPAQAVLHVGDSLQSDIKGAQEMGIPVLWINRRQKHLSANDVQPEYQSNNLSGLLEIIK